MATKKKYFKKYGKEAVITVTMNVPQSVYEDVMRYYRAQCDKVEIRVKQESINMINVIV